MHRRLSEVYGMLGDSVPTRQELRRAEQIERGTR
jgi:hypothetical protein